LHTLISYILWYRNEQAKMYATCIGYIAGTVPTNRFSQQLTEGGIITAFYDVTACNLVDRYQRFRGKCCLYLQGMMQEAYSPKLLVTFYQMTQRHIPEDSNCQWKDSLVVSLTGQVSVCLTLKAGNDDSDSCGG
jgi:hypothetical protein